MAKYAGTIEQMLQGVSQQPHHNRADGQIGAQVNCVSDIVDGLRRRPGCKILDTITLSGFALNSQVATHTYERGDGEKYMINVDAAGEVKVFDLNDGSERVVTLPAGVKSYLASTTPYKEIKFHTIADTTFMVNTGNTVHMAITTSPSRVNKYLLYIKTAGFGRTYDVLSNGVVQATYTTPATVTISATTQNKQLNLDPGTVAASLATQLTAITGITAVAQRGLIDITTDGTHELSSDDDNNNNDMYLIKDRVIDTADLPPGAPEGTVIEIDGGGESEYDNFWVKWVSESPGSGLYFAPGQWQETVAPGMQNTIDNTTMPVKIVRQSGGNFVASTETWGTRNAGNATNNPDPSFVGAEIQDIGSYQNRLYMLTGENVVMSRAFDQLQFFAESTAQGSDDDPVDSASSDNQVTDLKHAVIFNTDMICFSDTAQFIHPGSVAVTPSSYALAADSKHNTTPDVPPVVMGRSLIFPSQFKNFTNAWEYTVDTITGKPIIDQITKHLPKYIAGTPYDMVSDPSTGFLFIFNGTDLYVLQTYYKGTDRAQLSWHKWEFAGNIFTMGIANSKLYLIIQPDPDVLDYYMLELDLTLPGTENCAVAELFMDYYCEQTVEKGSYTINTNSYDSRFLTKWETQQQAGTAVFVQGDGCENPGMLLEFGEFDGGYFYFNNDATAGAYIYCGWSFDSSGELTNPYIKDSGGRPFTRETTLDWIAYNLTNTGYLNMTIEHKAGDDYTHVFNGIILNNYNYKVGVASLLDTREEVPVMDLRDLVTLKFNSSHHLGFAISSAEWQARMTARGRRSQ